MTDYTEHNGTNNLADISYTVYATITNAIQYILAVSRETSVSRLRMVL